MHLDPDNAMKRLPADYGRGTGAETVARDLLGRYLVRTWPCSERAVLKITETEAYLGTSDRASHAFDGRRSARNASLYLPGGHWYVYFIYGMYFCLNLVAGDTNNPEAVLIRAGVAVKNANHMLKLRQEAARRRKPSTGRGRAPVPDLAGGPGKLCQALQVDRFFDGQPVTHPNLSLAIGEPVSDESRVLRSPRVGIDYAGEARDWPLRFILR